MLPPKNQTVLITGASSGIGAEVARRFARASNNGTYDLLLFGRNETRLKQVQSECALITKSKIEILAFDLTEIKKHTSAITQKLGALSPLTILINNAGLFYRGSLEETDDEVWTTQFQVNLLSAVQLTKILWPTFKKNNKGSIVNISSTLGLRPMVNTGAYSAIKAAMINWTQSLAQEGGRHNIRANCICPGIVDTPIHAFHALAAKEKQEALYKMSQFQLLSEVGQPCDVAESVYFLASDASRWTTGAVLSVDGGITIK